MGKTFIRELAKTAFMQSLRGLRDETVVVLDTLRALRRLPDLASPQLLADKLQHYKLFWRDVRLPMLVDKLLVKAHVARALGPQWVTPTLWSGAHLSEATLHRIGAPAVIKSNHASGKVLFLHAGSDRALLARTANAWLRYDYHLLHREWAYGEVRRRLLIEPDLSLRAQLHDYKFWVFDGKVRLIQVDFDRFSGHKRQFYDAKWRRLDLQLKYPAGCSSLRPPRSLDAMLAAAERLADDFPFVRVDLYDRDDGPRFGEMTFWPEAGLCSFRPRHNDRELGTLWSYPGASQGEGTPAAAVKAEDARRDKRAANS